MRCGHSSTGLAGVWSSARERQRYQTFATLAVALAPLGWTLKLAAPLLHRAQMSIRWAARCNCCFGLLATGHWFWGIWRYATATGPHLALTRSLLVLLLGCTWQPPMRPIAPCCLPCPCWRAWPPCSAADFAPLNGRPDRLVHPAFFSLQPLLICVYWSLYKLAYATQSSA